MCRDLIFARALPAAFLTGALTFLLQATPAFAADPALIAAAQKEGRVSWYTTQIVNQIVRPTASAFEKKYGIKVDFVRANAVELSLRVATEAKAGRMMADVVDGTGTAVNLIKENLIAKYQPDNALPKQFRDPQGYWIATNLYVLSFAYNTNLVKKDEVPRTWQDLLNPKWKGQIVWNSTPSAGAGQGFIGTVLSEMGEPKGMEFLRALSRQNIIGLKVAARQVVDRVIAGEYAIAINIYNNHPLVSAEQGAPVDWSPSQPAMAVFSVAALTAKAPHPNAGKLLIDFITSPEGQRIYAEAGELPVDPNVAPKYPQLRPDGQNYRAIYFTPEELADKLPGWSKIYEELFR